MCMCVHMYVCMYVFMYNVRIYGHILLHITSIIYVTVAQCARPSLEDLQNNITPYYAAQWMVIGTILGIHSGILQGIEASYPGDAFSCCNMMFKMWLNADRDATWDKIYKAIPGVTKANSKDNGMYVYMYEHCW